MTARDNAIADLVAAASSVEVMGQQILVAGKQVVAVKKVLPQDEAMTWAGGEGVGVEVVRIVGSLAAIGFQPRERSGIDIDGRDYTVRSSQVNGDLLNFVALRYVG